MAEEINLTFRRLMKKYIRDNLSDLIVAKLGDNNVDDPRDIAEKVTKTKEIAGLVKKTNKIGLEFNENIDEIYFDEDDEKKVDETNGKNSFEFLESSDDDENGDDWDKNDIYFNKNIIERNFASILDKISADKPVHVRLAGYEALSKVEFVNNCNNETFELLLKSLRDGISDDKKPIFEASIKIHSKLFESSRSHDIYINIIASIENEYNNKKHNDNLPNFNTAINFKIYLHEKLIRLLYLVIMHQREILKVIRNADRTIDEMIDQFVDLLTWKNSSSPNSKIMSILNLISIIDPRGTWCKKLIHSMTTRKSLMFAISKTPNFLDIIFNIVKIYLKECQQSQIAYSITDDAIHQAGSNVNSSSVYISGETVETVTHLHCLNLASQLCVYYMKNNSTDDESNSTTVPSLPSPLNFTIDLINYLNSISMSTGAKSIYNESFEVLKTMLQQSNIPCDSRLFHVAISPLIEPLKINTNNNLTASHTIDVIDFILDSKDGVIFFATPFLPENSSTTSKVGSNNKQVKEKIILPASCLILHASDLLRQPLAVMNLDHILRVLEVIGKLCQVLPNLELIAQKLDSHFYPAIDYFYSKIDKYTIVHENKSQNLDSAMKKMLMKISSWPLGIWLLSDHSLVFEELIRTSINPLRHSWKSNDIVSLVVTSAFFDLGFKIIADLIPHTLSMFLNEICSNMEDIQTFYDPWDSGNVEKFIHVLSLISLNTKCIINLRIYLKPSINENNYFIIYFQIFVL